MLNIAFERESSVNVNSLTHITIPQCGKTLEKHFMKIASKRQEKVIFLHLEEKSKYFENS